MRRGTGALSVALLAGVACGDGLVAPMAAPIEATPAAIVDAALVSQIQSAVQALAGDPLGQELIGLLRADGVAGAMLEASWRADRSEPLAAVEALELGRRSLGAASQDDPDAELLQAALEMILDDAIERMEPAVASARGVDSRR